jgi:UDP-glucose:tetrahydrobiopterin glucosyltransferase
MRVIGQVAEQFPGTVAVHTQAQAETFSFGEKLLRIGNGFDLSLYQFCAQPKRQLGWVGRLAPEKGLEDAIAAAQQTGIPLKIWGVLQDKAYWKAICRLHRLECRQQVEAEYSLGALGERVEQWLRKMNLPLYKMQ